MRRSLLLAASLASSCLCVARGSRIRTPKNERLVEELAIGDEVLCVDPESGSLVAGKLSAIRTATRECLSLSYGGEALIATSDHPLYCPDARQWAPAGDWALGKRTRLLRASAGDERIAPVSVERTAMFAGVHQVFDLTVDHPLHNFVANSVLVHNKSQPRTCTPDSLSLFAETTCGPSGPVVFTLSTECEVQAAGALAVGLPASGQGRGPFNFGFGLDGRTDGGVYLDCAVGTAPFGDGYLVRCNPGDCNGTLKPK